MELSQRARVRAGDHDEFGVLFEEHARAVYNHAFRLTGNWSAAEEVLSLTFLEAWRLRGTVRPEGGSLLPWLLGIALNENGERTPLSPYPVVNGKIDRHPAGNEPQPNFTCPSEGHLGDATYRLMQSMPTQPAALLAYLKAGQKWTNDDPPTEIGDLIREAIVPPALAAALYRLAATLPGATLVRHATNVAGRAGIGIMWTSTSAKQVYKNEWIFDQTTLQFIGERIFNPKTGQVTGESAILQQAFTAKAGQRP